MKAIHYVPLALVISSGIVRADDTPLEQRLESQQQQLDQLRAEIERLRSTASLPAAEKNWEISSYGSMLYKKYERFDNVQDTDPESRAITDIERIVTEFRYVPAEHWEIEIEIEYEHGGTGSTLEYDGFEEFGEFETEVEAGGEVIVEKAQIEYRPSDLWGVKFGRIHVPVGMGTTLHAPFQYFTTERHWGEATLIPQVWHETGVNLSGSLSGLNYQALLTTGLNSEYFRTTNWVAGGHQTRFETVNADDLAMTLQLGYGNIRQNQGIALTYYVSDTSGNRHKPGKIDEDGTVSIVSLQAAGSLGDAIIRGQYLSGTLDDSSAISTANKNTAGLNAGSFTQVGSKAEAMFVEAAYNLAPLLQMDQTLQIFAAWEHANPLKEVESGSASDRYDQTETSLGVNFYPIPALVLKAQAGTTTTAQSDIPDTTAFSLSAGYYFAI